MKTTPQKPPAKNETTELYHADQAQGADYFKPQNPLRDDPTRASGDAEATSVPGSKPATNQKRKPE